MVGCQYSFRNVERGARCAFQAPNAGDQMSEVKDEVGALLNKLPDDCTLEDVQYHLYVIEKVRRGIARAGAEGTLSQAQAEARLARWLPK